MNSHRISAFRECEAALRNHDLKQALYDAGKVIMDGVLLTLHGDAHAKRRAVEVRIFRRNFFNFYEKEVFPKTLAETIAPYVADGGGDLIQIGYRLTVNLTADFAGIDRPERSAEETERLIALTKKLSEGATMVHSTRDPEELNKEVADALAAFDREYFQRSLARRRDLIAKVAAGTADESELSRDVLTIVLQGDDELGLSDSQILREIGFYMQAGSHSTANSVVHSLYEILQWAGNDEERWSRLEDPIFVQHCVHETLRLHPASPEAWRSASCPMHIPGAGDVPLGDRIELDLFQANRDPEIFGKDADIFDPDRVVPSNVLRSGLAFGIGLHTCLGRELDGGVVAKADSNPADAQLGIVPLVVVHLLRSGARLVDSDPPVPDAYTTRPNWGRFPIRFTKG